MTGSMPLLEEADLPSLSAGEEAGFGAIATDRGCLPMKAMDVRGRVDGLLARVTLRQTFVNVTGEPLEATYIFPLPDRSAVTGFRMEVNGRLVEGVLEERGRARREYTRAIVEGRRASIAEEERPGVFTLRVGNLMPGDEATVEFSMAGVLPYADGEVTFRFPLVVAPRYVPGVALPGASVGDGVAVDTDAAPDASRVTPPVLLRGFPSPVRLSISVDLDESVAALDDLRVSLHAAWQEVGGGVRRVTLVPGERLDRDFVLRFRLGGAAVRTSLSLHPDDAPSSVEGTFALTIVPPEGGAAPAPRPRDIAFVLDRSGSMSGWKMVAARRAMARMVDTLREADRFAVLAFDDRVETPPRGDDGLVAATDRNRFRAVEFLAAIESRGGTEMARPLVRAARLLADSATGRDRVLVLVTDGQVANEDQLLRSLAPHLGRVRVFTLGIDRAVNEGFLRRLAELGGGSCELVESEDRLDAVLDSVHRRIGTPVLTDLRLDNDSLALVADSLVPDRSPCLFAGSPLLLMGRYRGLPDRPVVVHARTPDGAEWREAVAPAVRNNPAIASAWARGQVRKLEDRFAAGLGDKVALESEIVSTSLRFGVLCRFTAYVAVDRAAVVNPGGEVHRVTQPVEAPSGWAAAQGLHDDEFTCMASSRPAVLNDYDVAAFMSPEASDPANLLPGSYLGPVPPRVYRLSPAAPACASSSHSNQKLSRVRAPRAHLTYSNVPSGAGLPPRSGEELLHLCGLESIEEVGRDGHGALYKAREPGQIETVTARVLARPVTFASRAELDSAEAALTGIAHPSIVPVFGLIAESGGLSPLGVVGGFVDGPSLAGRLRRPDRPDPREAARLVLALADALQFGHDRGVVHGGVTPGKVLLGNDGMPRLVDFGLTRLEQGPFIPDVRVYAAPELLGGPGMPSGRTDVYGLGVILYQLLTGVLPYPFEASTPSRAAKRGAPRPPRELNPEVPAELEAVCLKAMALVPAARYASAGLLVRDLRAFLGIKGPGLLRRVADALTPRKPAPRPAADAGAALPPTGEERREGFWK